MDALNSRRSSRTPARLDANHSPELSEGPLEHKHWVGLDVGETLISICVLDKGGRPLLECSTGPEATDVALGLSEFDVSQIEAVAMETGATAALYRRLKAMGYPVTVLNAKKTSRYISILQNKTDLNDARGLAELARLGGARRLAVHAKSVEAQQLHNQLIVRNRLVRMGSGARTSLRAMLRNHGSKIRRISSTSTFRPIIEAELDLLESRGETEVRAQLLPLLNICEALNECVTRIDAHLKGLADQNPITKRFMKIPGVGPICSLAFFAAIDDPARFRRSIDVGAYLGMVPKVKQSGKITKRSGITKAGNGMVRNYLVMAAAVMMSRARERTAIRDWGDALVGKIGYPKARMAVARKIAVAMLSIWKGDKEFCSYPERI